MSAVSAPAAARRAGLAIIAVALAGALLAQPAPAAETLDGGFGAATDSLLQVSAVPQGFEETVAFSGLTNPIAVRFAPDGRVFVAEKSGLVKYFDGLGDPAPTVFADLRTQVHDFWDRGLTGLELDPNFAANGRVYVLYTRNEEPFSTTMPRWPDGCPTPPGATADGCVVTGTLSRLAPDGTETPLIQKDFCQQYPSHSVGGIAFGADGMLYMSAGDGASFNFADYGQDGNPLNPCGDPPGGVGGVQTAPTAEGGALRSQDLRTPGDPAGLDGAVLRLDPATGAAAAGNPLAASADANARRIVAHGLRNPFRITTRPGTSEVWVGDVGWNTWEEINRIAQPTAGVLNFGWPCYEGAARQGGYDGLNLNVCENLYATGAGAHAQPYYAYDHAARVVAGESCPTGGSAVAGLDFYERGSFPDAYDGALFFADYTRDCIWAMLPGPNGLPDPTNRLTFVPGASNPVDVQVSPSGDLFYADLNGGRIMRVRWLNAAPTARASATPTTGAAPLTVAFDGSASSDPDGDQLAFAWDLDGDGAFDDATTVRPSFTYETSGAYTARLRVTDAAGVTDVASVTIRVGEPPTVRIDTPAAGTTWKVGDAIAFSGSARDAAGNPLTAAWTLNLRHCSRLDPTSCHTHEIQRFSGDSGSFVAPDHEYPSHLELELAATDAGGLTATATRRLDPRTVDLRFEASQAGLQLTVGSDAEAAPFTRTVIVGSTTSIAAPSPQVQSGTTYTFASWSDGGAASHNVVAPATATTYSATFTAAADPSLVAAFPFSEGSGATVGDRSGRGNHGVLSGAAWSAAGRYGGALSFDGVNDLVTVPDAPSLDLTTGMTIMGWVRPSALGSAWRTVMLKEQPSQLVYALYAGGGAGGPSGYIYAGGDRGVDGSAALPVGAWSHLASTYDGSVLRLYVNGTQVASRSLAGSIATSGGALRMGGNAIWGEWFAGLIDEVRVYDRALPAASIQRDMDTPVGGPQPPPAPTLAVAPESLAFSATQGGADPAAKDVAVSHDTGGALSWTAAADMAWLQVSPASGGSPGTVRVQPRIAGLASGTHTGTVTVAAQGAQGSPKRIPITLTVIPTQPVGGLVAALGFEEGAGTTAADASGRGNAGTVGGAAWTAAGRFGKALNFDGIDDWVTIADAPSLDLTGGMTLEAWVNPSVLAGAWRTMLLKERSGQLSYGMYGSGDVLRPSAWVSIGSSDRGANGTAALPTNAWTHVAATYNGSQLRLWVGGVNVATSTVSGSIATSTMPLRIGGNGVWGEWFAGRIDEVRVYDRALTQAELQADMATPVAGGTG